ncbi:MAG: DUF3750 domain-containing protein [Pseudomonadota bacterium]
MRFLRRVMLFLILVFIAPALLHLGFWMLKDRPRSWSEANWSSAGILPAPRPQDVAVYVMAARTGGLKGAFSTHSWLVIKKSGATFYDRYDVVGWGRPLRKNSYDADARWYSNEPIIHHVVRGEAAAALIPKIEAAIANYTWRNRGDYTLWPGPNSNSFVATIARQVPELKTTTPSTAVGRDFPSDGRWFAMDNGELTLTLGGYAGLSVGQRSGFELQFLGLVAGIDPARRTLKIPAFGDIIF